MEAAVYETMGRFTAALIIPAYLGWQTYKWLSKKKNVRNE